MRNRIANLLVLALLVVTCSVAYAIEKNDNNSGAKGILINAKTKKPIKNVKVQLLKVDKVEGDNVFFSGTPVTSSTDKAGVFVFKNVPVGKYLFVINSGIISAASGSYQKNANKNYVIDIYRDTVFDLGETLDK